MGKQTDRQSASTRNHKKGGKFFPALCGAAGTLAILSVIALLLPMTLPRLFGFEVYDVVSGSMSPAIPQGSLVVVRPVSWREIEDGDVIAFESEGSVVTHRVTQIREEEGQFITKGDANAANDIRGVSFLELIGRVELHIPFLGDLSAMAAGRTGKLRLGCLLLGGILLRMLGERGKKADREVEG